MSNNIEEDIIACKHIIKNFEDMRKNSLPPHKFIINSRDCDAIENILADRERLEKENKENRISILMYRNLRKCFQNMIKEILGEDYYNMGMDTYTCDKLACEDIINKKVKIMFKGKDKDLQTKANKYDSLVEKIKEKLIELNKEEKKELKNTKGQDRYYIKQKYMYQINILQNLLEKGENNGK